MKDDEIRAAKRQYKKVMHSLQILEGGLLRLGRSLHTLQYGYTYSKASSSKVSSREHIIEHVALWASHSHDCGKPGCIARELFNCLKMDAYDAIYEREEAQE